MPGRGAFLDARVPVGGAAQVELQAVELGHHAVGFGYGACARSAARHRPFRRRRRRRRPAESTDDVVHSAGAKSSTREVRLTKSYSKVKP